MAIEESIFLGFWRHFSIHCDASTPEHKRKNVMYAIMALVNAILNLTKIDPLTEEAVEVAGEVLHYTVLINYMKRFDLQVEYLLEPSADPPTPLMDIIQLTQDLLFIGQRHYKNPEEFGEFEFCCHRDYNILLGQTLKKILNVLESYTHMPLRILAINRQALADPEGYIDELALQNGLDFLL
jgi:hypothetical protein